MLCVLVAAQGAAVEMRDPPGAGSPDATPLTPRDPNNTRPLSRVPIGPIRHGGPDVATALFSAVVLALAALPCASAPTDGQTPAVFHCPVPGTVIKTSVGGNVEFLGTSGFDCKGLGRNGEFLWHAGFASAKAPKEIL